MPVTINEMNVNTNVQNTDNKGKSSEKGATGSGDSGGQNTELIIKECMQRILQELERRKNR